MILIDISIIQDRIYIDLIPVDIFRFAVVVCLKVGAIQEPLKAVLEDAKREDRSKDIRLRDLMTQKRQEPCWFKSRLSSAS